MPFSSHSGLRRKADAASLPGRRFAAHQGGIDFRGRIARDELRILEIEK